MSIGVSIIEDDFQVRQSLAKLIEGSSGFRCISQHGCAEEALQAIPQLLPEVVLMDINLPGINGVECVRQLKPLAADTQFIMLTAFQNTENIFNALAAGADGYLLKQTPPAELLDAIRLVHDGGSPMSGHIARKIVQMFRAPAKSASDETGCLSPRETQVLDLLSKGCFYKEIAQETGLAYSTVHSHIRNIYRKLQVRSRTEAVAKRFGQRRPFFEVVGYRLF